MITLPFWFFHEYAARQYGYYESTSGARLKEQAGVHGSVVGTVLDAVADTIQVDEDDMQIYTSGATNIFKYPELADTSKASELISAFEEKQDLVDLVKERMSDTENTGIQVHKKKRISAGKIYHICIFKNRLYR